MNIVLIGYRGTGKSSIGKLLASQLWMEFVDTDELVAKRAGQTIREIFASGGASHFRELEEQVVAEAAQRANTVIAAGGGVVLRAANVAALKRTGKIIWLQAEPETLFARINADDATRHSRPDLTVTGGLEEIKTVLAQRAPLYQAAAHATLDVTRLTVQDAAYHLTRLV